jgi:methionyl aminopeptidase
VILRKSDKDIEKLARSGAVLARTHEMLVPHIKPGVTTMELDILAEEFIREHGGVPTFKGYNGFPATLCMSPNSMVVHGIPGPYELQPGDLISIDCGVTLNGWVSDCAKSYVVDEDGAGANPLARSLIDSAYASLDAAIEQCQVGNKLGDISHAVQTVVERDGFAVIRKLVGHGVGRNLHEDPQITNFGPGGVGPVLEPGYVLAIEPMITTGSYDIVEDQQDGWSIYTADGSLAAHVEHTIAITEDGPLVLTRGDE